MLNFGRQTESGWFAALILSLPDDATVTNSATRQALAEASQLRPTPQPALITEPLSHA